MALLLLHLADGSKGGLMSSCSHLMYDGTQIFTARTPTPKKTRLGLTSCEKSKTRAVLGVGTSGSDPAPEYPLLN